MAKVLDVLFRKGVPHQTIMPDEITESDVDLMRKINQTSYEQKKVQFSGILGGVDAFVYSNKNGLWPEKVLRERSGKFIYRTLAEVNLCPKEIANFVIFAYLDGKPVNALLIGKDEVWWVVVNAIPSSTNGVAVDGGIDVFTDAEITKCVMSLMEDIIIAKPTSEGMTIALKGVGHVQRLGLGIADFNKHVPLKRVFYLPLIQMAMYLVYALTMAKAAYNLTYQEPLLELPTEPWPREQPPGVNDPEIGLLNLQLNKELLSQPRVDVDFLQVPEYDSSESPEIPEEASSPESTELVLEEIVDNIEMAKDSSVFNDIVHGLRNNFAASLQQANNVLIAGNKGVNSLIPDIGRRSWSLLSQAAQTIVGEREQPLRNKATHMLSMLPPESAYSPHVAHMAGKWSKSFLTDFEEMSPAKEFMLQEDLRKMMLDQLDYGPKIHDDVSNEDWSGAVDDVLPSLWDEIVDAALSISDAEGLATIVRKGVSDSSYWIKRANFVLKAEHLIEDAKTKSPETLVPHVKELIEYRESFGDVNRIGSVPQEDVNDFVDLIGSRGHTNLTTPELAQKVFEEVNLSITPGAKAYVDKAIKSAMPRQVYTASTRQLLSNSTLVNKDRTTANSPWQEFLSDDIDVGDFKAQLDMEKEYTDITNERGSQQGTLERTYIAFKNSVFSLGSNISSVTESLKLPQEFFQKLEDSDRVQRITARTTKLQLSSDMVQKFDTMSLDQIETQLDALEGPTPTQGQIGQANVEPQEDSQGDATDREVREGKQTGDMEIMPGYGQSNRAIAEDSGDKSTQGLIGDAEETGGGEAQGDEPTEGGGQTPIGQPTQDVEQEGPNPNPTQFVESELSGPTEGGGQPTQPQIGETPVAEETGVDEAQGGKSTEEEELDDQPAREYDASEGGEQATQGGDVQVEGGAPPDGEAQGGQPQIGETPVAEGGEAQGGRAQESTQAQIGVEEEFDNEPTQEGDVELEDEGGKQTTQEGDVELEGLPISADELHKMQQLLLGEGDEEDEENGGVFDLSNSTSHEGPLKRGAIGHIGTPATTFEPFRHNQQQYVNESLSEAFNVAGFIAP